MKAIVLSGITKAEHIRITEVPVPKVIPGYVLIKVKAFGMNHSEQILRLDEIRTDYIKKPIIPGIECVGEIVDASDTKWCVGQKVVALMGGMGRSLHGSYAEYALLPADHVFPVETDLPWATLAALPETFYTAWGSLFECLSLSRGDSLLVRGGSCSLGYAAIALAKAIDCRVIATTHRENKVSLLKEAGADEVLIISDEAKLAGKVAVTKALELIGPKTLRDTLRCVKRCGTVCLTGVLGGVYYLDQFDPIKEIPNGVRLTSFFSNNPTPEAIEAMIAFIEKHRIQPKIAATFRFDDIQKAVQLQDAGGFDGKIVVTFPE